MSDPAASTPGAAPPGPRHPPAAWRAWALALGGWLLLGLAYLMAASAFFGENRLVGDLSYGVALLALLCHVAAIFISLRGWRRQGGVPGVALSYLALALVGGALWGYERYEERQFYQEDPRRFSVEPTEDGVAVRTSAGVWRVPYATCPNRPVNPAMGLGTRQHDGVADLSRGGMTYMRLHVSERRVECLTPTPDSVDVP